MAVNPAARPAPKPKFDLTTLGALDLRDRIARGEIEAVEVAEAFLARCDEFEPEIRAWAHLDRDNLLKEAKTRDMERRTGRPLGPLHGLPVAIKDIIDVARMPCANGAAMDEGRMPAEDAALVKRLRAAGAVIMGKTVTAELAYLHPGKTRNPANTAHTPGGSSSGSAAAVAARMAPLAIGTQTGGSVIRPASYCGCVGFKPGFGRIPRTGVLSQSPNLDTIGVFAGSIEDAALLAEVIFGDDPQDKATRPSPAPALLRIAGEEPPVKPLFAMVRMPEFDELTHPDMRAALDEVAEALGDNCFTVDLPPVFGTAAAIREQINLAEMSRCFDGYARKAGESLSGTMREALEAGAKITAKDYLAALDWPEVYYAGLKEIFSRCDAILTAAAPGPAPEGLESTGSSIFNGLWTMTGVPALTLPLFESGEGLPMGLQVIGPREEDARLLRNARWLLRHLSGQTGETA